MLFQLANREQISMLYFGKELGFTYDDPGPKDVDIDSLSKDLKNQLLYNCRKGALTCSDLTTLQKACEGLPAASQKFTLPAEKPVTEVKSVMDLMAEKAEADKTELRSLLKEKIGVIRARTATLPLPHLKILLSLEKDWKARKAVVALLEELVAKHTKSVVELLGPEDVGMKVFNPSANKLDDGQVVEESEVEQVSLNIPSEEELKKIADGQYSRSDSR